jgi:hypothetical protein
VIVLYWLTVICLGLFAWLIAGVIVCIVWHLVSDAHKRRHYATAAPAPDRHTYTQDDVDRLAAECRDSEPGHQNLAWPPGTTTSAPHIERLPAPAACPECTWWYGGAPVYWPCPPHDPQFVTEWEGRLSL